MSALASMTCCCSGASKTSCPDGLKFARNLYFSPLRFCGRRSRGVAVDHATVHRWVIKLLPIMETAFR
ncbi:hypothetical protein ABH309_05260, partial [Chromobacterium piscinae]